MTHVLGDEPETLELSGESAKIAQLFVNEGLVPALRFVAVPTPLRRDRDH